MESEIITSAKNTIQKEAQALSGLIERIDKSFEKACELIFRCKGTVLVSGVGKSGLVARKWAATFSSTGTKAYFISPADAPHGDLGIIRAEDVLILLSLSGESEELGYLIRHAKENLVPIIGITGNLNSSLAKQVDLTVCVGVSEEACPLGLAPTTSTTLMMALGDAFAVALMKLKGFTEKDFARLHPGGSIGRKLWLRVCELMHQGDSIPIVFPDDPLSEVLIEMTSKCLGLAVVLSEDTIVGIITDGDLRRFFQKGSLKENSVARDVMTVNPKVIEMDSLAIEAREKMQKHSIQQLIVVDKNKKLVGVLHLYDLMRAKVL